MDAARQRRTLDSLVVITLAGCVTSTTGRTAVEGIAAAYPSATVQDRQEFTAGRSGRSTGYSALVYVHARPRDPHRR